MDIPQLTQLFMWLTIINGGLLGVWSVFILGAPNLTYRMQSSIFPISREAYNIIMYCFLGAFKLLYILFVVTPYIALLIIG